MPSLNMTGPFALNTSTIDSQVTKTSPGNYALGYMRDTTFIVQYVGRSDTDLNDRIGDYVDTKYKKFKYSYATSPKAAFEKECQNFHDFGGSAKLDNDIHPARPNSASWKCPVCDK